MTKKKNSGWFKKGHGNLGGGVEKGVFANEKNPSWKGANVSYAGLHMWVTKNLGIPRYCAYCQDTTKPHRSYHWANKSHAYKRDLSDWIRLCASCHKRYDMGLIVLRDG